MILLEKVPLSEFTTFKIGGRARYFCIIREISDLEKLINFIRETKLNYFILGGGSNLLIKDEGFDGIIIKPEFNKFEIHKDGVVKSGSGIYVNLLVSHLCNLGYKGLEWAGGLPGTVGGAIRGNAGCFGFEIKDIVKNVLAFNLKTEELKNFSLEEINFNYRNSFFKENKDWLIIEVEFIMQPYHNSQGLIKIMNEKINYRKEKHPLEYPNAGSIFKNIEINSATKFLLELAKENNVIKGNKIPTAFLIEYLGFKGKQIGGAKVSEKHANFIVNFNNAKAQDVLDLIKLIKEKVFEKFNYVLEEEIQIL
jgi:UDP-N-acetylmuramate dehydrogenase